MAEDERTTAGEDEVEAHRRHHHASEDAVDSEDTARTDEDDEDFELHRRHHH